MLYCRIALYFFYIVCTPFRCCLSPLIIIYLRLIFFSLYLFRFFLFLATLLLCYFFTLNHKMFFYVRILFDYLLNCLFFSDKSIFILGFPKRWMALSNLLLFFLLFSFRCIFFRLDKMQDVFITYPFFHVKYKIVQFTFIRRCAAHTQKTSM